MNISLPKSALIPASDYVILKDGDLIELNSETGVLRTDVDLDNRTSKTVILDKTQDGFGRELFSVLRSNANCAEMGGGINTLEKTHGNE